MEMSCEKEVISFLEPAVVEARALELSHELRLSDGMPDIARVLGVWGQPVLRSHRWGGEEISASGGVMAWVLYRGTDASMQSLNAWVPFEAAWDLPPECPEGVFSVGATMRFADGRSVSARRLGLRLGVSLEPRAYCYQKAEVAAWEDNPDVELLKADYPMRLIQEAGEKSFTLEEDIPIAEGQPKSLICARVSPTCTDCRVLGEKMAFRGSGNLQVLYEGAEGALFTQDYSLGFSQFAELDGLYGTDCRGVVKLCPEGLETDVQDGVLHVKLTLCAAYTISDVTMVSLTQDAYAPGKSMKLDFARLPIPSVLDSYTRLVEFDRIIPGDMQKVTQVSVLCDAPVRKTSDGEILLRGSVQVLGADTEGVPVGVSVRWEKSVACNASTSAQVLCTAEIADGCRFDLTGEAVTVHAGVNLRCTALCGEGYSAVSAMEVQNMQEKGSAPSLILKRFEGSLWDTAKACGSRMADIRRVNHLEGDPARGQMILIPVCG